MKKLIGFATQYYTLWDYESNPEYKTDAYGKHHQVGVNHSFYYIKNISMDIDKVKELYPSIEIDDSLRGKSSSFDRQEKTGLPENYFWGGKYAGRMVDEIMDKDFQYCVWSASNYNGATSEYIKNHPQYIAYIDSIEQQKKDLVDSATLLSVGDTITLSFRTNGFNANDNYTECLSDAVFGNISVRVFSGVKFVGGMYPYLMPVINGKAQKTRGKDLTVTISEVISTGLDGDNVIQCVRVL